MKLLSAIGTSLLLVLSCSTDSVERVVLQQTTSPTNRVIDSLPAPKDAEIRKIRTPDKWHNPYVIVCADGYELILADKKRSNRSLTLDELESTLLDLQLPQWPLGKVVAVQETGIRSPADNLQISSNLRTLKRMLASHKIVINLWPSG
jgi:hypothetical protein